jgi:hypothetical protein
MPRGTRVNSISRKAARDRTGQHALSHVQKFFPNVTEVEDATGETTIEVTQKDTNSSAVRNHKGCAFAVACKRKMALDGVIVSIRTAFVIKGNKAVRYRVPESVSREIVSFDRNAGFAPGEYKLTPFSESLKLGANGGRTTHTGEYPKRVTPKHMTSGIRAILGSKEAM